MSDRGQSALFAFAFAHLNADKPEFFELTQEARNVAERITSANTCKDRSVMDNWNDFIGLC